MDFHLYSKNKEYEAHVHSAEVNQTHGEKQGGGEDDAAAS